MLGLVALGLLAASWSPLWTIELTGQATPYLDSHDAAQIEVWFPQPRLLFGGRGGLYHRDSYGALQKIPGLSNHYTSTWTPQGKVRVALRFRSWRPPTRCTLAFRCPGATTRYVRQVPLKGKLLRRGHFSDPGPALPLNGLGN